MDHFTQWYVSSTNQEQYLYDSSGQRMLRRFTNGSGTTMLTYPFGIEEHQYSGSGTNQWNIYYYFLASRLLGSLDGNGTQFYLMDAQGSLISSFNNAPGGASMKSNQLFGPYGNARYAACCLNTAKGFIGQYNDGTGLDYFNARYYDPRAAVFLSADTMQGNAQGLNPYAYVNGNPETHSDPSGRVMAPIRASGGNGPDLTVPAYIPPPPPPSTCTTFFICGLFHAATTVVHTVAKVADVVTGFSSVVNDVGTIFNGNTSFWQKLGAVGDLALNVGMDISMFTGAGELARGAELLFKGGMDLGEHLLENGGGDLLEHAVEGCGLSFAPATLVATARGEQAIGTMQVGQKVWAYNSKAHKMELEAVLHVWINHDNDLVDLTLTTTTPAQHGKAMTKTSETIHTNKKHPFLTMEKGFLTVGQITLGMHVLRADGTYGVVTGWKVVSGTQVMYDLEVAQDHTFTVGVQQWVVHNCGGVLQQLTKSGYQLEAHFIERYTERGADVTAQQIVDVLQNGYHYLRTGDNYYTAAKDGLRILYTKEGNSLFNIIKGGIPKSGVTPLISLIPDWKNPFYYMDLLP